jgi:thiol-disulfide isomerase/thioredoxin
MISYWFSRQAVMALAFVSAISASGWMTTAAHAQAAAEAEAPAEVDLTVPDGDAAELQAFIVKLTEVEPQGSSQEEQFAHAKKVITAIRDAAVKMLAADPTEEQTVEAVSYRLMALQGLRQLGEEGAAKELAAAIDEAMADKRPGVAMVGWKGFLYGKLSTWDSLDEAEKKDLLDRVVAKVKAGKVTPVEVNIIAEVAQQLDNNDNEFAAKLLSATLPTLQKSDDEDVKAILEESNLEGMLRRLSLLGKPMEISGDLLGGGKIDWKSYRGKVVLVDFSATWCGPCVEEAPNVLNMYNTYKDKGFDVVAVSLDRTEEAAKEYVKSNGIQWATIFPAKEEDRYWNNPLVRYYGVTGIPTAILLDQKGNAIHMNARDRDLQAELERLFGPPGGTPKDAEAK